jgi:hypothetical protein
VLLKAARPLFLMVASLLPVYVFPMGNFHHIHEEIFVFD